MYKQRDVIAVHYPLTDKSAKTKLRPANQNKKAPETNPKAYLFKSYKSC